MAASLGVVLFFVLSGFLMGRIYLFSSFNRVSVWHYVVARFARVYPLFAIVILAGAFFFEHGSAPKPFRFGGDGIMQHLLFLGDGATVWTISVEFKFYAVFLLIWGICSFFPRIRRAYLASAIIAAVLVLWAMGLGGGRIDLQRYLHLFLLGVLASIVLSGTVTNVWERVAGLALPMSLLLYAIAFFAIPKFYNHNFVYSDMAICALAFVIVTCAVAAPRSLAGRALSFRPLVFLGEVSFGIYLLHRIVFLGIEKLDIAFVPGFVKLAIVLAATIFVSWLAFVLIERPSRRAIRRLGEMALTGHRPSSMVAGALRGPARSVQRPAEISLPAQEDGVDPRRQRGLRRTS